MFTQSLDVTLKGREFRIESVEIVVKDNDEDEDGLHIHAFKVFEGNDILNRQELIDKTFDFYDNPVEAVDGGFSWLKKHI